MAFLKDCIYTKFISGGLLYMGIITKRFNTFIVPLIIVVIISGCCSSYIPEGFVYLTDEIKTAELEMRYYSDNNFWAGVLTVNSKAILAKETAER